MAPLSAATIATIGALALSGIGAGVSGFMGADASDDALKQRNKEFLANLALQNKQLQQNEEQFRAQQKLAQSNAVQQAPGTAMNTVQMLRNLGNQQTNTADRLKSFIGA